MVKVVAVNISKEKGVIKKPVNEIILSGTGIENDAHAGSWHRQVSLLAKESIQKYAEKLGRDIQPGEFAENITTEGMEIYKATPLSCFENVNIVLQVTQIGKKCHGSNCAIFKESGDCVMPKEGVFARVIKGGRLKAGDILNYIPKVVKALIITLSDRASKGEYNDISGPKLENNLKDHIKKLGWEFGSELKIIPDEVDQLREVIEASYADYDVIFTTGSTGIGPRDIAPEALKPLLDKEIPGIMELIRVKYGMDKPNAILSRSVAGVKGDTLIYSIPGSPKAIDEYCIEIFKTLKHSMLMIRSIDSH
ncbi:hypothetical protein ES705_17006 [subsurface metagenome]